MKQVFCTVTLLLAMVWLQAVPAAAAGEIDMQLAEPVIRISTFYNGTTVSLTGSLPADCDLVVQVSGPRKDVHLKVKGKVAGVLWMNKDDVSLKNTPAVYMVYTPAGTGENLLDADLGLGYQALLKEIEIEPASADKEFIFGEYTKLMEKWNVYAVHRDAVSYGPVQGERKPFSLTLTIPPKMNAGAYRVEAVAVRDHGVIARAETGLQIELTGLPKLIASLAFGQPLLFGIMAVVIAVGTGLIIGALFKGGGGGH